MHRAICRVIRGSYKKFRENGCPSIVGEKVKNKNQGSNEEFRAQNKHSLTEAIGLTTGLILTYELTHNQRRFFGLQISSKDNLRSKFFDCPFTATKSVSAQPPLSSLSAYAFPQPLKVRSSSHQTLKTQLSPFLHKESDFRDEDLTPLHRVNEDDEDILFDSLSFSNNETTTEFDEALASRPSSQKAARLGETLAGDLMSLLGSFKLAGTLSSNNWSKSEGMELLEFGAELGSGRALYNIGVAYDKMGERELAREYFQRATDCGHPLAAFNTAILHLKEGRFNDGLKLLEYAADNGVGEAQVIIKKL